MKILVLGLDCAAPELLFGFEDLPNLRRLMEVGAYGRIESVIPPIRVPAWMCMATSQDPGSLGVYGFRNRTRPFLRKSRNRQLRDPSPSRPSGIRLSSAGKRSIIVGVPPGLSAAADQRNVRGLPS